MFLFVSWLDSVIMEIRQRNADYPERGGERWATEDRATQIRPLVKMDQFGFGFG